MTMQSAGDQQNLSEYNRSRTLQYLYHHGIASRAQIAQALHLTPAALSKISNHLLSSSAIIETGPLEGKGNRRSIGLAVNTGQYRVLGVKFARSLIQIGLFDLAGGAQAVWVDQATDYPTPAEAIDAVKQHIRAIMRQFTNIVAIGMAVPGPYLRSVGHTAVVSSMRQWREVNFKAEFEHAFGVPVIIEQDARAGALAQYLFDPQPHNENLAYYLLGEGIGLGVIDHGSVINGALGTATEIGQMRQRRLSGAVLLGRRDPRPAQRRRHNRARFAHAHPPRSLHRAVRTRRARRRTSAGTRQAHRHLRGLRLRDDLQRVQPLAHRHR